MYFNMYYFDHMQKYIFNMRINSHLFKQFLSVLKVNNDLAWICSYLYFSFSIVKSYK